MGGIPSQYTLQGQVLEDEEVREVALVFLFLNFALPSESKGYY